jgi:hypothetical protein
LVVLTHRMQFEADELNLQFGFVPGLVPANGT